MHDRLGSVRQIFDTDGNVVNYYFYDPWGKLDTAISNSILTNIYRFAGYAEDAVLGQYHCNARQYDPILGVFTAIDPIRGRFQEPLTLRPYLYCINDPINKIDTDGRWAVVIGGSFSGTITSKLLGNAAKSGLANLAKGGLGIHALMRQALISLLALNVDVGIGGTVGAGFTFGWSEQEGFFWGGVYWYGVGGALAKGGKGYSVTMDIGYSLNAQELDDLGGDFTEYGGSVTFKAPVVPVPSFFSGATIGGAVSIGDNGTALFTVSLGAGRWEWGVGAEAHWFVGHTWVYEWR